MTYRPRNVLLPVAAAAVAGLAMMTAGSDTAQAGCQTDNFIGAVCVVAGPYCPNDSKPAEGQLLTIQSYTALFAVLGNAYGGDGRVNFKLPDLRGRIPAGVGTLAGTTYTVQRGQSLGADLTTLTVANLPAHTHTATYTPPAVPGGLTVAANWQVDGATVTTADGSNIPTTTKNILGGNGASSTMWEATPAAASLLPISGVSVPTQGGISGNVVNGAAGGGSPQSMIPPALVMQYCIVTTGLFPPRP